VVFVCAQPRLIARAFARWLRNFPNVRIVEWRDLVPRLVEFVDSGNDSPAVAVLRSNAANALSPGQLALLAGCLPELKFIVTAHSAEHHVLRALRNAGMAGIIFEGSVESDLEQAVTALASGSCYTCESVRTALMRGQLGELDDRTAPLAPLSRQQRRVLLLMSFGQKPVVRHPRSGCDRRGPSTRSSRRS